MIVLFSYSMVMCPDVLLKGEACHKDFLNNSRQLEFSLVITWPDGTNLQVQRHIFTSKLMQCKKIKVLSPVFTSDIKRINQLKFPLKSSKNLCCLEGIDLN